MTRTRNARPNELALATIAGSLIMLACGVETPASWGQISQPLDHAISADPDDQEAQIQHWIDQLNESSLTRRRKAKEELVNIGAPAIPFLAKAALSDKRELIVYSLEVLGTLAEKNTEPETRDAARITLQMLADSDQPSTADRAKQILESKASNGIEAFPGWDDPASGFAGGGTNMNVSVSSINGVKTIRIDDGLRVTTFRDEPRNAIRVTVQEGGQTKEFVAKDLDDLKAQDPAAHALYEQHSNGVGGGVFGNILINGTPNFGNNLGRGNMLVPGQGGMVVGQNAVAGNNLGNNAANAMMIQHLEELKRRLAHNPEMSRMIEAQIEALKQK